MIEPYYFDNSNIITANPNGRYGTSEYIESMLKAVEKSIVRSLSKQVDDEQLTAEKK